RTEGGHRVLAVGGHGHDVRDRKILALERHTALVTPNTRFAMTGSAHGAIDLCAAVEIVGVVGIGFDGCRGRADGVSRNAAAGLFGFRRLIDITFEREQPHTVAVRTSGVDRTRGYHGDVLLAVVHEGRRRAVHTGIRLELPQHAPVALIERHHAAIIAAVQNQATCGDNRTCGAAVLPLLTPRDLVSGQIHRHEHPARWNVGELESTAHPGGARRWWRGFGFLCSTTNAVVGADVHQV